MFNAKSMEMMQNKVRIGCKYELKKRTTDAGGVKMASLMKRSYPVYPYFEDKGGDGIGGKIYSH